MILSGFNHPHLIGQLGEIGIYLDSVLNLASDKYPEEETQPSANSEQQPPKDEKALGKKNHNDSNKK